MKKILLLLSLFVFTINACQDKYPDLESGIYAEIVTNKGVIVAKLYHDKTPITVANFIDLAQGTNALVDPAYKGKPFFNGLIFHRVIKDFMIQGGDPLGNGAGNPGYKFPDEIVPELKHDKKGILSMANSGPATNGSQFFITLNETPWLDGRHTVFGEVVKGQEVIDAIGATPTHPGDRPIEDVVINQVNIINKGNIVINSFETEMQKVEVSRLEKEERVKKVKDVTLRAINTFAANAEELPSGLRMIVLHPGTGVKPNEGQRVLVDYEGYLSDGTLFDTSKLEIAEKYEMVDENRKAAGQYQPFPTVYGPNAQLIAGFREGLLRLNVGDEALLFIPSYLGYGERGAGNVIPPNSDLVFFIKITEILE
ncbi:MAG TPA: peptidylprolyl isomerase [Flavobacteriaceae bacterium]|nr:peptidylprolyl isomerase [Flavobacteriaceae bacterium]